MKKFLIALIFIFIPFIFPRTVSASDVQAGISARLAKNSATLVLNRDERVIALQNFLTKKNSPLTGFAQKFVTAADAYDVDWKLLPSISGVESSFGMYYLKGTFNPYGWGSGYIYFRDWNDGIVTINKAIKENYITKLKTDNVWAIGGMYAESKTWPNRVYSYMQELNDEYLKVTSQKIPLSI